MLQLILEFCSELEITLEKGREKKETVRRHQPATDSNSQHDIQVRCLPSAGAFRRILAVEKAATEGLAT